jgi:glycerol-3-phosphate dehydrogenase
MRVTVLGAGYMGSAMACVARRRGHDVRLWGTWLDDSLLDACERGEPHPRLKLPLGGVALFRGAQLASALEGADLVVHAVNSDGAVPVMTKAAAHLPPVSVLSVTKGLLESPRTGKMERIDVVLGEHIRMPVRFVHAGGPAKAIEIARGVLTWMQFAGPAGVGDLHVTAAAGRNRVFGERVGKGRPASQVAAEMAAAGELTEGYAAIAAAFRFARERGLRELPLLEALHAIVCKGDAVGSTLAKLRLTA